MLAIVFALEKFHQYTFAHPVTVHSDHCPLEAILKKPIFKTPRRLQGMPMHLQRYEAEVAYKTGKDLHLADTPSITCLPKVRGLQPTRGVGTDHYGSILTHLRPQDPRNQGLHRIWRKPADPQRHRANQVARRKRLPSQAIPYFPYWDELSVQDRLIFRGERVVIPVGTKNTIKERVHSSHLGVEGCLRRACEEVFWPNMNAELREYVQSCEVCQEFQTKQQKETLMNHSVPKRPWSKVGTDFFSIEDIDYLVTVDYTSNFIKVDSLENTDSRTVVRKLKAHFARYGIPDQVIRTMVHNSPVTHSHISVTLTISRQALGTASQMEWQNQQSKLPRI